MDLKGNPDGVFEGRLVKGSSDRLADLVPWSIPCIGMEELHTLLWPFHGSRMDELHTLF